MTHRLTLLLAAAAFVAAPLTATAQSVVPAAVAAGAQKMAAKVWVSPASRTTRPLLTPRILPSKPVSERLAATSPEDTPEVDLRAKDEWFEDEGLRIGATKVAYRQRF
ncbi:MAG: hypothetical protein U1C74_06775 [Phenylobacterium sp.]|nr:hypothetical protein [Phenylobacterium sp.]